jgi:hypothetical protein
MIVNFIALIFIVLVNVVLITSIFNFTRDNVENSSRNAIIIDVFELVLLLVVLLLCIHQVLYDIMDGASHLFIMILAFVLIVLFWSISRVPMVRKGLGIKEGVDYPELNNRVVDNLSETNNISNNNSNSNSNSNNNNNSNSNSNNNSNSSCSISKPDKNNVAFSKYVQKAKRNDFRFEELLPDYDKQSLTFELTKAGPKDYSAYNGYPDDHICSGCGCVKREDGYKYCGKFIRGMGMIGCSERWGCLNCKKCESGSNSSNNDYTCDNCKCHQTDAGYICGKIDRTNGYVHKCKSECPSCDKCYGGDSDDLLGDAGMITVTPSTSLNKVISYDLKTKDLKGLL